MSKKQKVTNAQVEELQSKKEDQISEGVLTTETDKKSQKKQDSKDKSKDNKDSKKKNKKKEKGNGGIVKKTKETVSELKKVTWPTFAEVLKKTGIVVAFVLLFGLFLYGLNYLLGGLVNLLIKGTWF